jgi:hypothetical protein
MQPLDTPSRHLTWFGAGLALVGSMGVAAAWIAVAMVSRSPCGWMAVIAALDAAWLLRLGGAPRGPVRMALGVAATFLSIALAQWGIASAHLSGALGMGLVDTALRLGPSLAWSMTAIGNGTADIAWMVAGLLLAAYASR